MKEKIWLVWLGDKVIGIVHAAIEWTARQIKEYILIEYPEHGFSSDIDLRLSE